MNDHAPDPAPWLHPTGIAADEDETGYDLTPDDCTPDMPERGAFCAAAYLATLESGFEFWPQEDAPSLCPWHWQLLLDRSARYDAKRALQNANAYAVALYDAVKNQMLRSARKSSALEP